MHLQWLCLLEICYRLSLNGRDNVGETNNIFLLLIKIVSIFLVNKSLTSR